MSQPKKSQKVKTKAIASRTREHRAPRVTTKLARTLTALESEQLLRRLDDPDLQYLFKHPLTQETAYDSLLVKRRRVIHRQVAQSIESLYADRLDEFAARLAQHYAEAGDDAKTFEYEFRAGEAASRIYANTLAFGHYTHALEIAKRAPTLIPPTHADVKTLYLKRGRVLELQGKYDEALVNYREMAEFARTHSVPALELTALMERLKLHSAPTAKFDAALAQQLADTALAMAHQLNDRAAEAKIYWNLMLLNYFFGTPNKGVKLGEKSLALARELDLREQLAYTLNDLANTYGQIGEAERGLEALTEAQQLWRELDNRPMLADSLITMSSIFFSRGEYDHVLELTREGNRISVEIGNLWGQSYSRLNTSLIHVDRGEYDMAIREMEESALLGAQAGFIVAESMMPAQLALVYTMLGNRERASEYAQASLRAGEKLSGWGMTAWSIIALIHVRRGELSQAQEALDKFDAAFVNMQFDPFTLTYALPAKMELALARQDYLQVLEEGKQLEAGLRKSHNRPFLADAFLAQARGYYGLGNTDAALDAIANSLSEARFLNERRIEWEILALWAELETARGNFEQARELTKQARQVLEYILAHTPPDLRTTFRQLPKVRAVLESEGTP